MAGPPVVRRVILWGLAIVLLLYAALFAISIIYPIGSTAEIRSVSEAYALDPALVASVVRWESRFRSDAVSPRGAIGLMQIMPETGAWIAEQLGVGGFTTDDLLDPEVNLQLGTWYLRSLLDRFENLEDALAAYNAGPSRLEAWRSTGEAPFPETSTYVKRVLASVPVYRVILRVPWLYEIVPAPPL